MTHAENRSDTGEVDSSGRTGERRTMPVDAKVDGAPTGTAPLVGRGSALRSFARMVEATCAGEFQFLAVEGEPGVGKTRLMGELAALAGARGLTTLWGRAAEFEQIMPFSALVDARDDHLDAVADGRGAAHRPLLPTVSPALPGADVPAEPDDDRGGIARLRLY